MRDTPCERGCDRPAKRNGLCWACLKSLQRNGTTARKKPQHGKRYETPEEMLTEAVINLSEAADKVKAYHRYLMASLRYRRRRNTVHKPPEY